MKLAYFPNQTALQSDPVWQAFLDGGKRCGLAVIENSMEADAAVIWSVLWNGRMRNNKMVFEHYRQQGKPVFIIEVGSLIRGKTWKVSVNNITTEGIYANNSDFLSDRAETLGICLSPENFSRKSEILIATQHDLSLQWQGMPSTHVWVEQLVSEIRKHSNKTVVVRPHPRGIIRNFTIAGVRVEHPRKIPDTYDRFDIDFNYHCVINWNSGVAVQAAIAGTPVITGPTNLANDISGKISEIEGVFLPDRTAWFQRMLHTEWTIDELAQGIPQERLLRLLKI